MGGDEVREFHGSFRLPIKEGLGGSWTLGCKADSESCYFINLFTADDFKNTRAGHCLDTQSNFK